MGYFIDRAIFGKDAANAILATRFLFGLIAFGVFGVLAVGLICYTVYQDVALELRYKQQYGSNWVAEFELYHGPVSRTNTHIIAGVLGMVSLVIVVGCFCWVMFRKHKHHRQYRAV